MFARRLFLISILLVFVLAGCGGSPALQVLEAKRGLIDLRDRELRSESIRLDGDWEFFWRALPDAPADLGEEPSRELFRFPFTWNGKKLADGEELSGDGFASFRIRILLPPDCPPLALRVKEQATAFRLFADGRLVGGSGTVGRDSATSIPHTVPALIFLEGSPEEELELVLQVSNFHHRNGGIWHGLYIGSQSNTLNHVQSTRMRDIFLAGIIFIICIYHAGLYAMRRKDRLSLVFAWFCFVIFFRHMTTGEKLLVDVFPFLYYDTYVRIEYITFFFVGVLGLHLVDVLFRGFLHWNIVRGLYVLAGALSIVTLFLPVRQFSWITPFWQPVILSAMIISFYIVFRAIGRRMQNAKTILIGIIAVVISALNDIAYTNQWIRSGFLLHFGLFALILCISIAISIRFSRAFRRVEELSVHLEDTNRAYARFVPTPFLDHLEKAGVTEIGLGDHVEREMALFFSDIRGFTRLSESMSPRENFDFLNSYLRRVSPVVLEHGGFIDKYIGDAIMALFPGNADSALEAAIQMQIVIREFNHHRMRSQYEPIGVGIGLHYGRLILGTVGTADRMDGTVISDDVNTASRIEGLTKEYGAQILVSEDLVQRLDDPERFRMRYIDRVKVRGKNQPVNIFEVADGQAEYRLQLFDATLSEFERGLRAFNAGDHEECRALMERVLSQNPNDEAARIYLQRVSSAGD